MSETIDGKQWPEVLMDKKLDDAMDYVCLRCAYPAFQEDFDNDSGWKNGINPRDGLYQPYIKYCERCMVKLTFDYYRALDSGREWSQDMPEWQAILHY